jgi:hypothetical protein
MAGKQKGAFMRDLPRWLPEMICVDGEFHKVVGSLYNIFHRDFIEGHPKLTDMDVWYDRRIKPGETYEEGFWHLITRDYAKDGSRNFDPRRAEKLPWCAPTLNNSEKPQVKYWVSDERGKLTCYVWLEDYDYVVILEKRTLPAKVVNSEQKLARTIVFLKSAYHVDGDSNRRYFQRKYELRTA